MASYSGVTSKEPSKNELESSLDACCASLRTLDENETMRTKLMYKQARTLIEYAQLYLSQCSNLNDKQLGLAENFNKYLGKLQKEDDVDWLEWMKGLERDPLREDKEVKNFLTLLYGTKYSLLSDQIHSMDKKDLATFAASLDKTQDRLFCRHLNEWKMLVEFLSKPGRLEASQAQKTFLERLNKI